MSFHAASSRESSFATTRTAENVWCMSLEMSGYMGDSPAVDFHTLAASVPPSFLAIGHLTEARRLSPRLVSESEGFWSVSLGLPGR